MIWHILYPVAWLLLIVTGIVLTATAWFLWRNRWFDMLDYFHDVRDKGFYRMMDMIMGVKGERS